MKNSVAFLLLLAACQRVEGGAAALDSAAAVPAASAGLAVAYRVPVRGGPVAVYTLPALERATWTAGRAASAREAVGIDLLGRRLFYRDSLGALVTLDLVASREKPVAPRGARAALGADGTLLAVDTTGAVIESQPWGSRPWTGSLGRGVRAVFAAPGARLLAVRRVTADSLSSATREAGIANTQAVPQSDVSIQTREADALAFAVDSGLVVFEDRDRQEPWFVRLSGRPRAAAFSPSGHRIYVALADRREIAVVDRFVRQERAAIAVPGPARDLRMDPWGRVLLARSAEDGDAEATWVISLARERLTGRLSAGWGSDLPAMTAEGVLLGREQGAVVARDLRTLDSLGALRDSVNGLWFAGRGSPAAAVAALRAAAADSVQRGNRPSRPAAATPPAPGRAPALPAGAATAGYAFYVQVSSSQNENWARALAGELNADRQRASVVPPGRQGEGWRVLTGPFRSRESADSAGRALNRPYWVVERPTGRTP